MSTINTILNAKRPTHINGHALYQGADGTWFVGLDSVHWVLRTGLMRVGDVQVRLTDAELAPSREYFDYVRFERGHWGPRPS